MSNSFRKYLIDLALENESSASLIVPMERWNNNALHHECLTEFNFEVRLSHDKKSVILFNKDGKLMKELFEKEIEEVRHKRIVAEEKREKRLKERAFKRFIHEQYKLNEERKRSKTFYIKELRGMSLEEAQKIVESMGGTLEVCISKIHSYRVNFEGVERDFLVDMCHYFRDDVTKRIKEKSFLIEPRVYKHPLELSVEASRDIVERMGGTLRETPVRNVWRVDFTELINDFKEYVLNRIRLTNLLAIPLDDCPLITHDIAEIIAKDLTLELSIEEDELIFTHINPHYHVGDREALLTRDDYNDLQSQIEGVKERL